jgi:hypothetical protein
MRLDNQQNEVQLEFESDIGKLAKEVEHKQLWRNIRKVQDEIGIKYNRRRKEGGKSKTNGHFGYMGNLE